MCGIAGLLTLRADAPRLVEGVREMSLRMQRRGPDDDGLWTDDHSCVLAVRRLSIVDTSAAGHQPMLSEDGRHAIAFNGELYDFAELRRDLEGRGVRFRSRCDTEVVLQALVRWGPDALARFNGMFALAFYDAHERSLLLARDHAGIKPLYLLRAAEGLLFASQFDQILAHEWAESRGLSQDGLSLYMHLGHIPAPHSLLADTEMLEPGSWLRLDAEGRSSGGRHYTFPVHRRAELHGQEAAEAVGEAVGRAVRRQIVADVPVGTFLSGGIDSPLVATEMQRACGGGFHAFTFASADSALDESPDARRDAQELGLQYEEVRADGAQLAAALGDATLACADPLDDASLLPTLLVCARAREHVKVLLSGDGGDDLFWGYVERHRRALAPLIGGAAEVNLASGLVATAAAALRRLAAGLWPAAASPGTALDAGARYLSAQRFVALPWLERVLPGLPPWPEDFRLFECDASDPEVVAQWLRWNEYSGHLPRVLLKVDRASMFHSLEVRVPLLDKEVVEVASRTHWTACLDLQRDTGKIPLRQSLVRRTGRDRPGKRGFSPPMGDWLRSELRPLVEDELLARNELLGLSLDRAVLQQTYRRHLDGGDEHTAGLWRLLNLSLWERSQLVGRAGQTGVPRVAS